MMPEIVKVLELIRPGAEWNLRGDVLEWLDKNQPEPTAEELAAGAVQLTGLSYKDQRKNAYPSVGDQLDALWKGGQAAADMLAAVQAVKDQFPKP